MQEDKLRIRTITKCNAFPFDFCCIFIEARQSPAQIVCMFLLYKSTKKTFVLSYGNVERGTVYFSQVCDLAVDKYRDRVQS